jgi:hypothetical protein
MIALIGDVLVTLSIAGFAGLAITFVVRLYARIRRHHPWANRRFLARYRAQHPASCRTTVEAPPPEALPVVRPRTPAGVDRVPPNRPTPAGPTAPGRHAT